MVGGRFRGALGVNHFSPFIKVMDIDIDLMLHGIIWVISVFTLYYHPVISVSTPFPDLSSVGSFKEMTFGFSLWVSNSSGGQERNFTGEVSKEMHSKAVPNTVFYWHLESATCSPLIG